MRTGGYTGYTDRRFQNVDWKKTREVIGQNTDAINLALTKFLEQHPEIDGDYLVPGSLGWGKGTNCFGLLRLWYKHTTGKGNRVLGSTLKYTSGTTVSILANLTEREMETLAIFAGSLDRLDQRLTITLDFTRDYAEKYAVPTSSGVMVYKIGLKELPRL